VNLVGILVVATIAVVSLVTLVFPHLPVIAAPMSGTPAPPIARNPVPCPGTCLTEGSIVDLILPARDFEALTLPVVLDSWGEYAPSTLPIEYKATESAWLERGGAPDRCFPLFASSPVALPAGHAPVSSDDVIDRAGTHTNRVENSYLEQTVRIFPTSEGAEAHMHALATAVAECGQFTSTTADYLATVTVTAAPTLTTPDGVAEVAWLESATGNRTYVIDLQRSNLVVRTFLTTDGTVTEAQFRAFAKALAQRLATVTPPVTR
jgi:hypothetical protein